MTLTENLALIEAIISERPQGIGIAELQNALGQRTGAAVQLRTLQRRLALLLKNQRIVAKGQGIAVVYKPALPGAAVSVAEAGLYVPVSAEGAAIRDRVRLPLMHRRPVGYHSVPLVIIGIDP